MRRLSGIFNRILQFLRLARTPRPEDIPKKLSPEVLERVMHEARFLSREHGVDVRSLSPGEIPGIPRPADGKDIY